jgi:hypothetical protein
MSELYGRKTAIFVIFQILVAASQNLYTIMVCQFLASTFGSSSLAVCRYLGPMDRGVTICIFAAAVFVGPILGKFTSNHVLATC